MPIYEYSCHACGHQFEALVRGDDVPSCPSCDASEPKRLLSLPKVQSETTRSRAMRAAKKRDASLARERMHQRMEYENSHDRHG